MGVKFGDIDSGQIIENEYRIRVLEYLLENIMQTNSNLIKPDHTEMRALREKVVQELNIKYPNSGIRLQN